jgi:hypothetical protein
MKRPHMAAETMQPDRSDVQATAVRTCSKCGGAARCTLVRERSGWFGATREYFHQCDECKRKFATESMRRTQLTIGWSALLMALATFMWIMTGASGVGILFKIAVLGSVYGFQSFYLGRSVWRYRNLVINRVRGGATTAKAPEAEASSKPSSSSVRKTKKKKR